MIKQKKECHCCYCKSKKAFVQDLLEIYRDVERKTKEREAQLEALKRDALEVEKFPQVHCRCCPTVIRN